MASSDNACELRADKGNRCAFPEIADIPEVADTDPESAICKLQPDSAVAPASDTRMCALVPPKPKELMPATRGLPFHRSTLVGKQNRPPSRRRRGLISLKLASDTISPCCS